jgi:two-component system KDP operon response regulator KdpE
MAREVAVLIVDDEPPIRRFLKTSLSAQGYRVVEADTGASALKEMTDTKPDLVVLDLGLPDMNGLDVIRAIRKASDVPIVVLSVRGDEQSKVAALDLGADDYVTKPFGMEELIARLRTAIRHRFQAKGELPVFVLGEISVDLVRRLVKRKGEEIKLSPKEYDLLKTLVVNAGKVLTHRHILTEVWGPAHTEDAQYLRVFIRNLRHKLEADPARPALILTCRRRCRRSRLEEKGRARRPAPVSSAATAAGLFYPRRRVPGDAEIGVLADVDICIEEAKLALRLDVGLERLEIGHRFRAAVIVLALDEQPGIPNRSRNLGRVDGDLHRRVMVLGILEPAYDADRVLHEIDHGGAVLLKPVGMGGPDDHLRPADGVLLAEQRMRHLEQIGIGGEGQHAWDEVDLMLRQHFLHVGEGGFDKGDVGLVIEVMLAQHGAHGDIHRAAGRVGRQNFALQILDLLDRTIVQDEVLVGIIAGDAILEIVADDPQVGKSSVLHGERERGIGKIADIELIAGERGDHRRRALETRHIQAIGLVQMRHKIGFRRQQRGPIGHRHDIAGANLDRVGACATWPISEYGGENGSQRELYGTHCPSPADCSGFLGLFRTVGLLVPPLVLSSARLEPGDKPD